MTHDSLLTHCQLPRGCYSWRVCVEKGKASWPGTRPDQTSSGLWAVVFLIFSSGNWVMVMGLWDLLSSCLSSWKASLIYGLSWTCALTGRKITRTTTTIECSPWAWHCAKNMTPISFNPTTTPRKLHVTDKADLEVLELLLLSCFSCVRFCAAHQAPPSLGFSRQEHWSGLPFPSPMHESEKGKWSHSVVSDSSRPHGLQPTQAPVPVGPSRQEYWSGLPLPSPGLTGRRLQSRPLNQHIIAKAPERRFPGLT